jgi:outer membrane protein assembly factor BamB
MKRISRKKLCTIPLILMLTLLATIMMLNTVFAQVPEYQKQTHAYIGAIPNPTGVGQEVLLHIGITDELQLYWQKWEGLTVTVTKPDGTTETLGPFNSDSTGGTGTIYVPLLVGTYKIQTHFPEQWHHWTRYGEANILYEASDSEILELVVQEDPIEYYPGVPLPSEYWTRPIDAQHREWSPIAGSWLADQPNYQAPYNDAPETGHILWAKPLTTGGLVGGELGNHAMECGDAYEGKFDDSVIINGILYYNRFCQEGRGGLVSQGIVAVDLRTGEELWFRNNTRLTFGQIFYWDSFNVHGAYAYLWEAAGGNWNAYDPFTGEWVYTIVDVPSGTRVYGPKGEIYVYTIDLGDGWMSLWNSSRTVNPQDRDDSWDGSWARNMGRDGYDRMYPAERGIEWNVTIPTDLPGSVNEVLDDRIIGTTGDTRTTRVNVEGRSGDPVYTWAISLEPGREGEIIFNTSWQPPAGNLTIGYGDANSEDDVFTMIAKETRQTYGFSVETGEKIWGPTESQNYMDFFSILFGGRHVVADGKVFSSSMSGITYAYDVKTGQKLWEHVANDPHNEILWSVNWPMRILFLSDGKLYLAQSEHSVVDPKPRGGPFICLDVETGEEIWRMDGGLRTTDWGGRSIIGDSIIATYNSYDQQIYAVGKGPSATTVTAPDVGIPLGSSIMIRGTVTDVSAGTKDSRIALRFPNGVPAIADADMSEWMKYVYMQFPMPDANGVSVTLDAIDPNDNFVHIDTVQTSMSGLFSTMWTPEIEGEYTVIATFEGTKSYWPSYAETAIGVVPAPTPATPIEPEEPTEPEVPTEPGQPAEEALISTEIAIILAVAVIAVIGVAAYWVLRKRQ